MAVWREVRRVRKYAMLYAGEMLLLTSRGITVDLLETGVCCLEDTQRRNAPELSELEGE